MLSKLTRSQYYALQEQFERLPDLGASYSSSGEHYQLIALLNTFGFHPSGRDEAIKLAERLLANEYQTQA